MEAEMEKKLSKEENALVTLNEELPKYVVESFVCSGYDTLPVIAKMNESSIEEIEQFITEEFKEDPRFAQRINSKGIFKFLPGHRHRIADFISAIKLKFAQEQTTKRLGKRKRECDEVQKKAVLKKHAYSSAQSMQDTLIDVPDQKSVFESLRQQVAMWQREPKRALKLKSLQENKDFEIKVNLSQDSSSMNPSIVCKLCNHKYVLGTVKGRFIISNWTRHVTDCVEKAKAGPKISTFFQGAKQTDYPHKDVLQNDAKESKSGINKNGTPTPLVTAVSQSPLNAAAKEDLSLVPSGDSVTQDEASHDTDLLLPSASFVNEKQSPLHVTAQQRTSLMPSIVPPTQDESATAAVPTTSTGSQVFRLSSPVNRRGI